MSSHLKPWAKRPDPGAGGNTVVRQTQPALLKLPACPRTLGCGLNRQGTEDLGSGQHTHHIMPPPASSCCRSEWSWVRQSQKVWQPQASRDVTATPGPCKGVCGSALACGPRRRPWQSRQPHSSLALSSTSMVQRVEPGRWSPPPQHARQACPLGVPATTTALQDRTRPLCPSQAQTFSEGCCHYSHNASDHRKYF